VAEFQFTPTDGFKNKTSFPNPSTEDQAREQVQSLLDQLRDAYNVLNSVTDGASGADNVKATPISTSPNTVQGILEWLKAQIDLVVANSVADNSLDDIKLSNTTGQIKERTATHIADTVKHITALERTAWNSLKSVSGTFTDTTTSITAGAEYTKTIPLGLTGVSGGCQIRGASLVTSAIIFNTSVAATLGIGNYNTSSNITQRVDTSLATVCSDSTNDITLKSCYIDGTNLKFIFKNNGASTKTLYVTGCIWEVQA
jgi:hypothetical protein